MNNTELIITLKKILKSDPTDLRLQKYAIAMLLTNNPTYKQLAQLREIVHKHNWEVNVIGDDRKTAYMEGLERTYYKLINDMMLDIVQGIPGKALKTYTIMYKLY